jgi:hypothetical protein
MRLRKVINREYEGTTYYRWLLSVPPKDVRALGWVDGQELTTTVHGSTLWIVPSVRPRPSTGPRAGPSLEEEIQRKSARRR